MKSIVCLLIMLAFCKMALAQYHDLIASKNINAMLINFTEKCIEKGYDEEMYFNHTIDTVWSYLDGKLDSSFTEPFVFFGSGHKPYDYNFEHQILTDGSECLKIHLIDKGPFDRVNCRFVYTCDRLESAQITCFWDTELQVYSYYECSRNTDGIMQASTPSLKEFEERIKKILQYL